MVGACALPTVITAGRPPAIEVGVKVGWIRTAGLACICVEAANAVEVKETDML